MAGDLTKQTTRDLIGRDKLEKLQKTSVENRVRNLTRERKRDLTNEMAGRSN
jgi:hypothetical protein